MMASETAIHSQTLAQRLAQGRLPVPEALRNALILAEALRKIHDGGQVHGAVSPASISVTRTGLELLPALGSAGDITPYTAPEVIKGKAPDARSDIFSFGAIVYEMLTARPAFKGDTPEALASAIVQAAPPPSGSPAVDKLVASCLAKEPGARLQKVQKLTLELKLLSVAVRRAEASAAAATRQPETPWKDEIHKIESRLEGRLCRLEQGITGVLDRLSGVETSLRVGAEHGAALDQRTSSIEQALKPAAERFESMNNRIGVIEQALKTASDYIERLEHGIDSNRQENATLRQHVGEDLVGIENRLKSQESAIESARTAMAQTDDLVERVVEALESLQSVVLDSAEERVV
jgi:serine/threonine protein kinase